MFCCTLLYVRSSIAIILMGKRELVSLLILPSWCLAMAWRLFLAMPRGCLRFVIVVFPDHTHLLFFYIPATLNRFSFSKSKVDYFFWYINVSGLEPVSTSDEGLSRSRNYLGTLLISITGKKRYLSVRFLRTFTKSLKNIVWSFCFQQGFYIVPTTRLTLINRKTSAQFENQASDVCKA